METTTQRTTAEALEAAIEHALSMSQGFHEILLASTGPPDGLMAFRELEDYWLGKAKRLEARRRSLQDAPLPTR